MRSKAATPDPAADHPIAIAAFDGMTLFEVGVALEAFAPQSFIEPGAPWYRRTVCGTKPTVEVPDGLRVEVPCGLDGLLEARTIVVPPCNRRYAIDPDLLDALRTAHARGARLMSLCTGAFILAAAGLLNGRRATTHWESCGRLAAQYPEIDVDPNVLYVDEGDILTAAGSAASIDLCLHVVRKDFGAEAATGLARELVVPPHRDGGQAQYIAVPIPEQNDDLFAGALAWAQQHLDEPLSIEDLARRSAMSRRTFARRFQDTTGTTPYQWLTRQRVQLAQRLLETTDLPVDTIAEKSGFGTAVNLRKHFAKAVRTSPHSYRRTFQTPSVV